jgi:hypothetical protein
MESAYSEGMVSIRFSGSHSGVRGGAEDSQRILRGDLLVIRYMPSEGFSFFACKGPGEKKRLEK